MLLSFWFDLFPACGNEYSLTGRDAVSTSAGMPPDVGFIPAA
jgi:hypothetical protein